jgi:mannose-6-phosphate isomerase-like protein (cupin superfamily)
MLPDHHCPTGSLFRPLAHAPRADLIGRTVWTLSNAADGFGDATISLARIPTGTMNAHAHAPGGEFMFVVEGRGRVWIEGVPLPVERGSSAFIPAGLLHNAENRRARDLVIVGVTAPGVVPGSYAEVPPLFAPTGRIRGLGDFTCASSPDSAPGGAIAVRLDPSTQEGLSVRIRLVMVQALSTVALGADVARAWVAIRGTGTVACDGRAMHRITRHATHLSRPGVAPPVTAGPSGLTLLEIRHAVPPS